MWIGRPFAWSAREQALKRGHDGLCVKIRAPATDLTGGCTIVKQLTGLDASFLYMETPTTFGHVNGLGIYQRPSPDFDPFELVYKRFEGMIGRLEPMRRRLVQVPLRLDHPYWIDDPDFDLDYHVRHIGLAPPGAADQLAEQVARIVARPMDRSHPLWECYVIEGLADGRWAMLTKTHHSTIDGASGVILLNMLTDTDPDASNTLDPVPWTGEPIPQRPRAAADDRIAPRAEPAQGSPAAAAAGSRHRVGRRPDQHQRARLAGTVDDHVDRDGRGVGRLDAADQLPAHAGTADPMVQVDHVAPSIRDALDVARQHQGTQGRHRLHRQRHRDGDLRRRVARVPRSSTTRCRDKPLRAMVPVSIRTGDEEDPWTNRVSSIIAELPDELRRPARAGATRVTRR